ncbi:MAG: CPBP family intramembrane metalloprotease [Actinomycetia bacterium]|nr:CPBP family intramembrane metalloprotease [Actinomycetes bacterium]
MSAAGLTGAALLGVSLSSPPGSSRFYVLTTAVAGTWTAGALASGPLHRGWIQSRDESFRRPVVVPILTGVAAFGLFYGGALVVRRVPILGDAVTRIMRFADDGASPLVLMTVCANGAAEEVFFRGALYSAIGADGPVLKSALAYTAATSATRNPALVLASALMGTLLGLQRRASGGIQAPTLTHLTWSLLMLRYIPPLFRERAEQRKDR